MRILKKLALLGLAVFVFGGGVFAVSGGTPNWQQERETFIERSSSSIGWTEEEKAEYHQKHVIPTRVVNALTPEQITNLIRELPHAYAAYTSQIAG